MQIETIKASKREEYGKRPVARLRKSGAIPGIMYGHGEAPLPIAVDRHAIELMLAHGGHIANIELGGQTQACLIKDVQYDHLGATPLHVDFARIDLNQRVTVRVPLELRGHAKGQAAGGAIAQLLIDLEVECLAMDIPDLIRVNIADLDLNQALHVREIALPEGVACRLDPETIIAVCREVTAPVEPAPGAAVEPTTAEPEVIAKGKVEKEGEGEAAAEKPEKKAEKK